MLSVAFFLPHFRVVSLCMSPVNDSFMSGSLDHSVRIWDLRVNACQVGPPIPCKTPFIQS